MTQPAEFRWNDWNLEHATKHGVSAAEAERVVRRNPSRKIGNGKWRAVGRGTGDRWIEVIYVLRRDDTAAYIIHSMSLTTRRRRG